jgi:hypothetical protein
VPALKINSLVALLSPSGTIVSVELNQLTKNEEGVYEIALRACLKTEWIGKNRWTNER